MFIIERILTHWDSTELENARMEILALQSENYAISTSKKELSLELKDSQNKFKTLEIKLEQSILLTDILTKENRNVKEKIDDLSNEIENLTTQSKLAEKNKAGKFKIEFDNNFEDEKNRLNSEKEALKHENVHFKDEITSLNYQIEQLSERNLENGFSLDPQNDLELKDELKSEKNFETENSNLRNEIKYLKNEIEDKNSSLDLTNDLAREKRELQSEKNAIHNENENLRHQIETLNDQIEELNDNNRVEESNLCGVVRRRHFGR